MNKQRNIYYTKSYLSHSLKKAEKLFQSAMQQSTLFWCVQLIQIQNKNNIIYVYAVKACKFGNIRNNKEKYPSVHNPLLQ